MAKRKRDEEEVKLANIFSSIRTFPRVLRLVFSSHAPLTLCLGLVTIARGLTPAATVTISQLTIDSVLLGIRTHTITPLFWPVSLQLLVALGDLSLSTLSTLVQQLLQTKVTNRVQLLILEKAETLDLTFFEDAQFYDRLRQASDESSYRPLTMIMQTFDLARTLITLCSMLFLLLQLAWWLAMIAALVPIPTFLANIRYARKGYLVKYHQSQPRRLMAYFVRLMTTDTYHKEIRLFNLGEFFTARYRSLTQTLYEQDKRILVPYALINLLWPGVGVAATSGVYLYVALQAVLGSISLGALVKLTQATTQTGQSMQGLLSGISSTYENTLYITTLYSLLAYEPRIVSPAQPAPLTCTQGKSGMQITFRQVSFTYPGKTQPALNNVSFTIQAGEAIALVGRNGAGKTTLVKLLARLYDPDEGEILVNGHNIKEYDLGELREQIGVIFQDYVQYEMKASENIGIGHVANIDNHGLIESAARKSGADSVIERLSDGYQTLLGRMFDEGVQLSGGEWQKVALARAFLRDAPILILDEPTSALDAVAEHEVFTRFRLLTSGKTAIFISHRFSTVRLADHIFVIEDGHLVEDGSHDELVEQDGRYAHLFSLQAQAYR